MADKAHINPVALKWARTSARISVEIAAHHLSVSEDKIKAWEDGTEKPTIKQAEKLAHQYRRPFAVLFLPKVPKDFQPLRDFRCNGKDEFSTAFIFMMREVQEKQLWARSAFEDSGEAPLPFVGKYTKKTPPENVAKDIRETLGIKTNELNGKALRYWIQKAEASRIFISLSSNFHTRLKLDSEEVKGFAIADPYAPFIFLNTDDWDNPQLFTLVHELAHIWINQSGISVDTQIAFREGQPKNIDPIEVYCNQVAANALLPQKELEAAIGKAFPPDFRVIEATSRKFGVSNLTLLYRLYELELISQRQLGILKKVADHLFQQYIAQEEAAMQKPSGGPNYYIMQVRRNGRAFSQLVMDYYKGGFISGIEASHLLKVKLNNFPALEKHLYR